MVIQTGNAVRKTLAFGIVAALVLIAATTPARAAFPGLNGKIVFYSARNIAPGNPSTKDTEIFSMNPNGTGLSQLTVNAAQDFDPVWSADGTRIAFDSRQDTATFPNPGG